MPLKKTGKQNSRRIELIGAYNFRDAGGYYTIKGQTTSWRKLFRSDTLTKLTKSDLGHVEKLNIQIIIDLGSKEERVSKPNRLPMDNGIRIKNIDISENTVMKDYLLSKVYH